MVWARICVICVQLGVVVQVGPELVAIIPCLSMELFSRCVKSERYAMASTTTLCVGSPVGPFFSFFCMS